MFGLLTHYGVDITIALLPVTPTSRKVSFKLVEAAAIFFLT